MFFLEISKERRMWSFCVFWTLAWNTSERILPRFVMRALPSIYTKIYLIFFLALHAEFRVRVLRTVDFNLAKVIQDFSGLFSKVWE